MSARRIMVARTSFASDLLGELAGKHPAVIFPGVIRQETRLFEDDPIVLRHPEMFIDASTIPGPNALVDREARGLSERQIRKAAADLRKRLDRAPTVPEGASELHTTEPTLRRAMRDLGMGRWPPAPPED